MMKNVIQEDVRKSDGTDEGYFLEVEITLINFNDLTF